MKLRDFRLSDYRLAAYVVVAAGIAGGVAFGLDRAFAPAMKVQANGAPPAAAAAASGPVRQITIARTSAVDLGDPEGKLTPVYPTSPGKDLPIKDTPVVQAVKPTVAATTTGSASAAATVAVPLPAPAPVGQGAVANAASATAAPQASAAPQANACNIAACAATYRSFRESDCSYQPSVGARRICEGAPGIGGQSSTGQIATQPPAQSRPQTQPPAQQQVRTQFDLRRLPPPPGRFDDDERGVVVMEAPEQRYDLRRNWVSEPQD